MEIEKAGRLEWSQWIELYKTAVEEYRFQVRLNADRTQHFLLLNGAIMSAGIALLQMAEPVGYAVAAVFFVGMFTSGLGVLVTARGHSYYRMTAYKKMLLEDVMGLHEQLGQYPEARATLAITTTQSMQRSRTILQDPSGWIDQGLRPGTVVFWTAGAFWVFAGLDGIGIFVAMLL